MKEGSNKEIEKPIEEDGQRVEEDEQPVDEDEQPNNEDEQPVEEEEQPGDEDEQPINEDEMPVDEDRQNIEENKNKDENLENELAINNNKSKELRKEKDSNNYLKEEEYIEEQIDYEIINFIYQKFNNFPSIYKLNQFCRTVKIFLNFFSLDENITKEKIVEFAYYIIMESFTKEKSINIDINIRDYFIEKLPDEPRSEDSK